MAAVPSDSWSRNTGQGQRKLFEYFIVAGLKDTSPEQELSPSVHENGTRVSDSLAPITDICVIFPGLGEKTPTGYECVETTPLGYPADLNHGSWTSRAHSAFLCFRRGYHKSPLTDIGVLDEAKGERPATDVTIVDRTPFGHSANVNNTSHGLYFTTRRAMENGPPHQLVVTDICVIITSKGEVPPHTYYKIEKNLNMGMVGSDVFVCYKKSQSFGRRIAYKPSVLDCFPRLGNIDESLANNVPMFCLPMGALIESWPVGCRDAEKMFSTCVLTDDTGTNYYGASLTFYERCSEPLTREQMEKLELEDQPEAENNEHRPAMGEKGEEKPGESAAEKGEAPASLLENGIKEEVPSDGTIANKKATYHRNKAICILSRYPFFGPFRRFLNFIYSLSCSGEDRPQPIAIERYISHLMYEVPFPCTTRPRVLVQLGCDMIAFESHDDSQIPLSGAAFVEALKNLGTEHCIYAMLLALLEQKILVHSLRPWMLTSVAETIGALMFPFHWQCPYIPQCPLGLAGVLHAPLPFIVGVHSRYFELYEVPPPDVTCFDLDTGTVSSSATRKELKLSMLPKKPLKRLRTALESIKQSIIDADVRIARKGGDGVTAESNAGELGASFEASRQAQQRKQQSELAIREAFLRFMCSLMAGYTRHLRPIMKAPREVNATDTGALFDLESFLRSRDKQTLDFYRRFTQTQCFHRFIEERSFLSEHNVYAVFFDDCMAKMEEAGVLDGRSKPVGSKAKGGSASKGLPHPDLLSAYFGDLRLLDAEALSSTHTIVVPPPEPSVSTPGSPGNNHGKLYRYSHFPERFDYNLFELDAIREKAAAREEREGGQRGGVAAGSCAPKSALYWAIRTKQEARMSLAAVARLAEREAYSSNTKPLHGRFVTVEEPHAHYWPKTVLFYAYSLWFLHLPSLIAVARNKPKMLLLGFRILTRMEECRVPVHDQLCYRILIHLCGEYGRPQLATRVLVRMRRAGLPLNAITYGIYHKALMQGDWPSQQRLCAIEAWRRVRTCLEACSAFREFGRMHAGGDGQYYEMSTPENQLQSNSTSQDGKALGDGHCADGVDGGVINGEEETKGGAKDERTEEVQSFAVSTVLPMSPEHANDGKATELGSEEVETKAQSPSSNVVATPVDPLSPRKSVKPPQPSGFKTPSLPAPSPFATPKSRQQFLKEHSASPFTGKEEEGNDDLTSTSSGGDKSSSKKRGFKLGGTSWLKSVTTSPVISKLLPLKPATATNQYLSTPPDKDGEAGSLVEKTESLRSASSLGSPSILSLVHSVRKQAQRSYDEVLQQGNVLLNRSGINALVREAAKGASGLSGGGAGRSGRDTSTLSTSMSDYSDFSSNHLHQLGVGDAQAGLAAGEEEPAFLLDSGSSGDLVGAEYWMRELLPTDIGELRQEWLEPSGNCSLDVALSSCSPCANCATLVYDEELVAGWSRTDDSNLNSQCPYCGHAFLPSLKVCITKKRLVAAEGNGEGEENAGSTASCSWYIPLAISLPSKRNQEGSSRHQSPANFPESNATSSEPGEHTPPPGQAPSSSPIEATGGGEKLATINVPYLNPLVLRREMEVLVEEDPLMMARFSLRTTHPIVFWNLLYYCRRLDLPSHLLTWISPQVHIRCVFDVPSQHREDHGPIYIANHSRPPFKFLHDVVSETMRVSGFLQQPSIFTKDELDPAKAASSRDNKVVFLQKLIDVLNVDGSLDAVRPAKIVAGREPELTNLLLQKLAEEATRHKAEAERAKKKERGSGERKKKETNSSIKETSKLSKGTKVSSKIPTTNGEANNKKQHSAKEPPAQTHSAGSSTGRDRREAERNRSEKERRTATAQEAVKPSRENGKEELKTRKKRSSSKDKEKRSSSKHHSTPKQPSSSEVAPQNQIEATQQAASDREHRERLSISDEGIHSPHVTAAAVPPAGPASVEVGGRSDSAETPPRESSGATSKGGDDSGIAEDNGGVGNEHGIDVARRDSILYAGLAKGRVNSDSSQPDVLTLARPMTASGARPQTSMGRPGTAMARPAPPRQLKRTKLGDLDTSTVTTQPSTTVENATLMLEKGSARGGDGSEQLRNVERANSPSTAAASKTFMGEVGDFLVEEDAEEEALALAVASAQAGASVAALSRLAGDGGGVGGGDDNDAHGALVNKILKNARELERSDLANGAADSSFADAEQLSEQKRVRLEIELIQRALQKTAQGVQPLARTLEFVAADFDTMLREIEESRRQRAQCEALVRERSANNTRNEKLFTLSTALKNLEEEIADTREQLATARAHVLQNEKKLQALLLG